MTRQRRRDTQPELLLRRRLHAYGLRYRIDAVVTGLPRRRVDVLFPGAKVAVLVDGCFWHGCPLHSTVPKTNQDWWVHKISDNVGRDRSTDDRLTELGWTVVRVWEHDDPDAAAAEIAQVVRSRRDTVAGRQPAASSDPPSRVLRV